MKNSRPFLILFLAIIAVQATEEEEWKEFKARHRKMYRSALEDRARKEIFTNNLRKIADHNRMFQNGEVSYEMGINHFADMTSDEFVEMLTLQKKYKPFLRMQKNNIYTVELKDELPEKVNWTEKGAVTEIKNQMDCGSCWSFSTTGSIEGQLFMKTGNLTSLSEQNLVDCVTGCFGCHGGIMDTALNYVKENGIMREEDYPYKGKADHCWFQSNKSVTKIESLWFVEADETVLQDAVARVGPISAAIDATGLQHYKSGIYRNRYTCKNDIGDLNHGVLVVGYGAINGSDYWLVKNSWGRSWGVEGYVLMTRNHYNQCGIATYGIFPRL